MKNLLLDLTIKVIALLTLVSRVFYWIRSTMKDAWLIYTGCEEEKDEYSNGIVYHSYENSDNNFGSFWW